VKKMMKFFGQMVYLALRPALLLTIFSLPVSANDESKIYSFGVVPQQSASQLVALWGPLLTYLSEQTGIKLQFKTAKNIPKFESRLAAGDYDFAYMNPYHFTFFNREPGYRALVLRKDQPIRGIILVHKDSSIESLEDLEGQRLAFPAPAAFAASVLPRAELNRKNIKFNTMYVSSHDSMYLGVAKGLFAAGGGVKRTFNNTSPEVKEQLKILWTSAAFTPHAIAVHPSVDDETYQRVQRTLVEMIDNSAGKDLLTSLKIKNGFIKATDSDWDDVRALNIDLLNQLIKE
jgi:phosphonate transport system substrate-binding protein